MKTEMQILPVHFGHDDIRAVEASEVLMRSLDEEFVLVERFGVSEVWLSSAVTKDMRSCKNIRILGNYFAPQV